MFDLTFCDNFWVLRRWFWGETVPLYIHKGVVSRECSNISLTIQNEEEVFSIKELRSLKKYLKKWQVPVKKKSILL